MSDANEKGEQASAFTISDLAREFSITPRTIRFWEDQGLLAPSRDGRNRVYTKRDRTRLKLALRGNKIVSVSLAEAVGENRKVDQDLIEVAIGILDKLKDTDKPKEVKEAVATRRAESGK